jgi:hypothetical protein
MDDYNITVLVDAKEQYTKQLISILKTCIYQGIKSIYMDSKDICHQDNTPDNVLMIFQDLLSRIPKWSQDIINKEFERITNVSKCDYIDDLLKVVYVSHIKILTIVHSAQKNKKLSLKIPSGSHFIHLCYIECAREFWKDPYLLSDRGSKFEQQKNMRDSENMIAECISETIRKLLPIRNILKDFLNEPDEDINEEDDSDIKEPINKKYLKKLETVVKKELKTVNTISGIDIDLIRQVIREEIDGKPETNTIKKELVDTVVEKIIEKNNDSDKISSGTTTPIINTDSNEKEKKTKVKKEVKIEDKIDIIPIPLIISDSSVESETSSETSNKPPITVPSSEPPITVPSSEPPITIPSSEPPNTVPSSEPSITKTSVVKKIYDYKDVDIRQSSEENINTSLANILNEDNYNVDTNAKGEEDDEDENENENENEDENEDESSNNTIEDIKYSKTKKNELFINNIDEINLNLDELENDECEEINIDDLSTIDLIPQNNKNEVKTENTKYIFFNDSK